MAGLSEKELLWVKYRWEFVRRNADYRKLHEYEKTNRPIRSTNEKDSNCSYIDLFLITNPDPNLSFEDVLMLGFELGLTKDETVDFIKDIGSESAINIIGSHNMNPNDEQLSAMLKLIGKGNSLCILINPSKINSIDTFKKTLLKHIDHMWSDYQAMNGKKPEMRLMDKEFELFLRAGDLRREGKTYIEIAKMLFPRDFNEEIEGKQRPESAIKKAEQYCRRYDYLVNDGWLDMKP